jgi:hypothetical protein
MLDDRYYITFKVSDNEEAKAANDTRTISTIIHFKDWTDEDFKASAAETVKIRQIQSRLRTGKSVGEVFVASRPGTRAQQDPVELTVSLAKAGKLDIDALMAKLEALKRA